MSDNERWEKLAAEALEKAQRTADQRQKRTLLAMAAAYTEMAEVSPMRRLSGNDAVSQAVVKAPKHHGSK